MKWGWLCRQSNTATVSFGKKSRLQRPRRLCRVIFCRDGGRRDEGRPAFGTLSGGGADVITANGAASLAGVSGFAAFGDAEGVHHEITEREEGCDAEKHQCEHQQAARCQEQHG